MNKEKECKIPLGTLVETGTKDRTYEVFDYLLKCKVINSNKYNGNSPDNIGRSTKNTINYPNYHDVKFNKTITFEEFKRLIKEPVNEIINDYNIY